MNNFDFVDGLALLFIVCKWCGVIEYSWWWLVLILFINVSATIQRNKNE